MSCRSAASCVASPGALAVAEGARRYGISRLIVPAGRAREAALVDGIEVARQATSLGAAVDALNGKQLPPLPSPRSRNPTGSAERLDLCDVRGHALPLQALKITAAGGHNLMLEGPPGTGKTMLARRLPSILPPLTREEAVEVTRIHSVAGLQGDGLAMRRPFRAPHHSISSAGLVGGGTPPRPGEGDPGASGGVVHGRVL